MIPHIIARLGLRSFLFLLLIAHSSVLLSQEYFPENGARTYDDRTVALTGAIIHVDADTRLDNATLLIRDGLVVESGTAVAIPADALRIDLPGKHIYPSFIDLYTDYGIPELKRDRDGRGPVLERGTKGAMGWNEAIMPEYQAISDITHDDAARQKWLKGGFGALLSHRQDGIMRGSGSLTTLEGADINESIVSAEAAHFLSFSKGSSRQNYPSSLMGAIALIRQTFYDAEWYASQGSDRLTDRSLEAAQGLRTGRLIFETEEKNDIFRAEAIAKEFGLDLIYKGSGQEYERASDIATLGRHLILPLVFPKPYEVGDPFAARSIPLSDLRDWEQMPANASYLYTLGQRFSFTADGLESPEHLREAVRQTIRHGLTETVALRALTLAPAEAMGVSDRLGSLKPGRIANLLITSGAIFNESTIIHENWVQGHRHILHAMTEVDIAGSYDLNMEGKRYTLSVSRDGGGFAAKVRPQRGDTTKVPATLTLEGRLVSLHLDLKKDGKFEAYRLSGTVNRRGNLWDGKGQDPKGVWFGWNAIRTTEDRSPIESIRPDKADKVSVLTYPNMAFGWSEEPQAKNFVIRNATVWTNTEQGIMQDADVVVAEGRIIAVGHNLDLEVVVPKKLRKLNFTAIEAYGKHVTCGIIDEHSHIAITRGVNEATQASTAEVSIGDVVDPDDIDIYRQLAGGVTAAQLLHGSANPIGGRSAIIKLKWGLSAERMKIRGADGFIKFALGENVKQSNWGDDNRIRFPQTRMGVEQVYYDHFIRAREYAQNLGPKRRDLDLEALAEILAKKRFITCHSYVRSEIDMLMHVADSMGFTVNTFTHILEGYKLADKMAEHGAAGSTFSDWWAYKFEVNDAIPQNAALMHEQGVLVGINSDDAEMGRRLNQEAAKVVKYGGVSEEEAWKMVTLNPAKMLHLDDRMGSVADGMDADLVLWSDHPLSIYAKVEQTYIEGQLLFDQVEDKARRSRMAKERNALIQKMLLEGKNAETQPYEATPEKNYHCDDYEEYHIH